MQLGIVLQPFVTSRPETQALDGHQDQIRTMLRARSERLDTIARPRTVCSLSLQKVVEESCWSSVSPRHDGLAIHDLPPPSVGGRWG